MTKFAKKIFNGKFNFLCNVYACPLFSVAHLTPFKLVTERRWLKSPSNQFFTVRGPTTYHFPQHFTYIFRLSFLMKFNKDLSVMWYNNSDTDIIVITSSKKFPWSKPFYSRSFTHFVRFRLFTFCVEYYRILWPKFTLYITEHFSFVDLVVFFPFRIWHKKYAKKVLRSFTSFFFI